MILVLQTTVLGRISVWLVRDRRIIASRKVEIEWHGSDRALAVVDQTLRQKKKSVNDIKSIIIVRGPGSFTAVRTGLIIANTLGMLLRIPVRGIVVKHRLSNDEVLFQAAMAGKKNFLLRPWYGKSPNITLPKLKQSQARAKR